MSAVAIPHAWCPCGAPYPDDGDASHICPECRERGDFVTETRYALPAPSLEREHEHACRAERWAWAALERAWDTVREAQAAHTTAQSAALDALEDMIGIRAGRTEVQEVFDSLELMHRTRRAHDAL